MAFIKKSISSLSLAAALIFNFSVEAAATISTFPQSSLESPSGQHHLLIVGNDIPAQTWVQVFEKTRNGDIEVASREIELDDQGYFRIPVHLTNPVAEKKYSFYIKYVTETTVTDPNPTPTPTPHPSDAPTQSSNPTEGRTRIIKTTQISNTVDFYFSSNQTIQAPSGITVGNIEFLSSKRSLAQNSETRSFATSSSSDATSSSSSSSFLNTTTPVDPSKPFMIRWADQGIGFSYNVYRRIVNEAIYDPMKCLTVNHCYLDTPYEIVQSSNATAYRAEPVCDAADCRVSASYFIVATRGDEQSNRSKNIVINDQKAPKSLIRGKLLVSASSSEENKKINLNYCMASKPYEFFGADIDLDLKALVSVKKKTSGRCVDQAFNSDEGIEFDSLIAKSLPNWPFSCVPVGSIGNLQPETTYCVKSCLADNSGYSERTSPAATLPDRSGNSTLRDSCQISQITTSSEATPSIELKSVRPASSGTSLQVEWGILSPDFITAQQVKNFAIEWTDEINQHGDPLFDDASPKGIASIADRSYSIENLKTAHNYCVRVKALGLNNESIAPTQPVCRDTLDNRLRVTDLNATAVAGQIAKLKLQFNVINPNPLEANEKVEFVALEIRTVGNNDWRTVSISNLVLPANKILNWSQAGGAESLNEIIFDTFGYFGANQNIEFKITVRRQIYTAQNDPINSDDTESSTEISGESSSFSPISVYSDMGSQSSYTNSSFAGCSLNAEKTVFNSTGSILLSLLGLALLWRLRRTIKVKV